MPIPPPRSGMTWSAASSADPVGWNAADTTVRQNASSRFQARDNYPDLTNPHRFLRLKITRP